MNAPITTPEGIPVVWRETPLSQRFKYSFLKQGLSIEDLILELDGLPDDFFITGVVKINGEVVPRNKWRYVRPLKTKRSNDTIPVVVELCLPLLGGGGSGGKKNPLATIASIALLVTAVAISAGALGPAGLGLVVGNATFAAGSISAAVAAAAVGLGGSLAIAALAPPPSLGQDAGSSDAGLPADPQGGSAALGGNILRRGSSPPRVLGQRDVTPPLLCQPLIEQIGEDEYVEGVYCLGGPHAISNPRADDAPIDDIDAIQIEYSEGFPTSEIPLLVGRYAKTDNPNLALSKFVMQSDGVSLLNQADPISSSPQWNMVASRAVNPDEIWFALNFQGFLNNNSPTSSVFVPIRVRIRPKGTTTWINLPEIHIQDVRSVAFSRIFKLMWRAGSTARPIPLTDRAPTRAFAMVPWQDLAHVGDGGWAADTYFLRETDFAIVPRPAYSGSTITGTTLRTYRVFIDASVFTAQPNNIFKIRFKAASVNLVIHQCFVSWQVGLEQTDFDSAHSSRLTVGGSIGFTVPANGDVLSDAFPLGVMAGQLGMVISFTVNTALNAKDATLSSSFQTYYRDGIDEANIPDVDQTLYTNLSGTSVIVSPEGVPGHLDNTTVTFTGVQNCDLYAERAEFYLTDLTKFPKGKYDIQIMRGQSDYNSSFTAASYHRSGSVYNMFGPYLNSGVYSAFTNQNYIQDSITLSRISGVYNSPPATNPGDFALIAVRAKNRQIGKFVVEAGGYVKDYNVTTGLFDTYTVSQNPAPHYVDALGGELGADAIPQDIIEFDELIAWRQACIDLNYTINAVVSDQSNSNVLDLIAAAGFARKRQSETWGVGRDYDRTSETIRQVFSPINLQAFRFEKAFNKPIDAFRVSFDNSELDYDTDEIVVPLVEGSDIKKIEDISYATIVDEAVAINRAKFDLQQGISRMTFYYGEADVEAINSRRNDLVGVQHDILTNRAGFARVKQVLYDTNTPTPNVTGLILEGSIPAPTDDFIEIPHTFTVDIWTFLSAAGTGVCVALKDGTKLTAPINASDPETKTIAFTTPFPSPGAILCPDLHLVSGRIGSEYKRLVIFDIKYKSNLTATITFVDEAPELNAYF